KESIRSCIHTVNGHQPHNGQGEADSTSFLLQPLFGAELAGAIFGEREAPASCSLSDRGSIILAAVHNRNRTREDDVRSRAESFQGANKVTGSNIIALVIRRTGPGIS